MFKLYAEHRNITEWRKIYMIKNVKKGIVVASIIAILGGSTAVSAANNFRFSMVSNVIGKKEFNLKNKTTNCESKASTYRYNTENLVDFVGRYSVNLDGNGFLKKDYEGTYKKADGKDHTTGYGKINKNTYTVNVVVDPRCNLIPQGGQIKGEGEIKQVN